MVELRVRLGCNELRIEWVRLFFRVSLLGSLPRRKAEVEKECLVEKFFKRHLFPSQPAQASADRGRQILKREVELTILTRNDLLST